ncbi:MsnO8 family LLM class oxidoreductase [Paenibacillus sp. J22TS3]|uniref:MsnO8 family LLM class oxidoreductase n=1 Tax=Paenibacillus sp. J22TS3 TaxID=2807192 RepID=UPI001B09481F|nr:MsnO8 family LLM class oxidoreductase [Paenibacillus sp. J22TS3]GIP21675.1 hypothetical protein J22TS3_19500 [Paenibacillus sp. J22TS3]
MEKLKLGVLDLAPVLNGYGLEDAIQETVRLAQKAEEWGYEWYWAAEHHDLEGLACPSPEILLAHIGARTNTIRLGSGALLLPHYSPMKVAESFHLLSCLYPGRIDLGIGRAPGGPAHASMALSGNFLQHVAEMPDSLRSLTELLTGEYRYEGEQVTARPMPKEPPKVWMLGTNTKSCGYAAEFGTGFVFGHFMSDQDGSDILKAYRGQFKPGKLRASPETMIAVSVICAETDALAEALGRTSKTSLARTLVGSPERILDRLREVQFTLSNDSFLIVSPLQDYNHRLNSYRLIAQGLL